MTTKITFTNEPKLSEHEVDRKFNERRIAFIPHIEQFISKYELFQDSEVNITFSHGGVSSIVCILEIPGNKFVLKIPLSLNFSLGEGQFLKVWEGAGVKVPHIFEDGILNGHAYVLMEYIEAPTLIQKYSHEELLEKKIFIEIGSIMRKMHTPKTHGFGRPMEGGPEFKTFKEWLESEDIQERIIYVQEHHLLGDEYGSMSSAQKILLSYVGETNESSYCHEDVGTHNVFDTEPLTIFDPNPRFNHGYWDLARTMFSTMWHGQSDEVREQLILGYFDGQTYDTQALQSAVLLNACYKFPYSHKKNKVENMKNVQDYLVRTKHLLEEK